MKKEETKAEKIELPHVPVRAKKDVLALAKHPVSEVGTLRFKAVNGIMSVSKQILFEVKTGLEFGYAGKYLTDVNVSHMSAKKGDIAFYSQAGETFFPDEVTGYYILH